jgi:hypothetical protein
VHWTKSDIITGSRYTDGNVPYVNWNDGKLKVNWTNLDNANPNLRSRVEVSNSKKKSRPGGISFILYYFLLRLF